MSKIPIVDFSRFGDAAVLLVDRLTDSNQKRERADAKAYAKQVRTKSDIERRALLTEQRARVRRQENAERIAEKAARKVQKNARHDAVSPDWYAHALERLWNVSDDDLQELWASILAGEVNSPGSFSKKTLSIVEDVEKEDAEIFSSLCRFSVTLENGEMYPIVYHHNLPVYKRVGINYNSLIDLASMGLIKFDGATQTFFSMYESEEHQVFYLGRCISLTIPKGGRFDMGYVKLTRAGAELCRICDLFPIDGHFEYLLSEWSKYNAREQETK